MQCCSGLNVNKQTAATPPSPTPPPLLFFNLSFLFHKNLRGGICLHSLVVHQFHLVVHSYKAGED